MFIATTLAKNNQPRRGGILSTQDNLGRPWVRSSCRTYGAGFGFGCFDYKHGAPAELGASVALVMDLNKKSQRQRRMKRSGSKRSIQMTHVSGD